MAGGYNFAYWLGGIDKRNEIVYNCRDYGRYNVDETWRINCVGPFNPLLLIPEYKPYPEMKEPVKKGKR